jgi:succinate dehydrogenase / fumarate reductase, membrane anchor subunit
MSGSARTTRSGRARPGGGGFELAVWYLMRLTGLALFVLALSHFSITHFVFDPANQTSQWIVDSRWGNLLWRTVDWAMLTAVIFHSFIGVRTVVQDYTNGGVRTAVTMALYLLAFVLFAMGTMAVASLGVPVK